MKLQLRFTEEATTDLTEIWKSIAQDNPEAATRFCGEIYDVCEMLAEQPRAGRVRQDLQDVEEGLRSFPHGNYLIFYAADSEAVLIIHVLHGKRDIRAAFENRN